MKIEFIRNSYKRFFKAHKREILSAITRCLSNGDFILQNDVEKFEKTLANYVGVKYAVGVNSGTDALFLSLKALGVGAGDEVIVPSHTFIASIQVIVHCGAKPILIDVKRDGLMDCDQLEGLITQNTKAIMPVHLSGKVCDMSKIQDIAARHNLFIIEDSCQSLGSLCNYEYNNKDDNKRLMPINPRIPYPQKAIAGVEFNVRAGAIGDTGCFSFISPKSLGGISDGGAVVTDNKALYEKLLLLRNHWNITQNALMGHQPKQAEIMGWGWNSRLGNVTAAYLNVKFKYYNKLLARRKEIAQMYNAGIKNEKISKPIQYDGQIYSEYIINVDDPVKFKNYLAKKGIETLIRDLVPNHLLKGLNLSHFSLPVTEELAKIQARLPIYPELKDSEVKQIIKAVNDYV